MEYSYGKLGEVIENNRTFVLPKEDSAYSFKMTYEYDSWNRIQKITYPDRESVFYTYDLGGNLDRVYGYYNKMFVLKGGDDTTNDEEYESDDISDEMTDTVNNGEGEDPLRISRYYYYYIDSIHYDKFGSRSDVWYGNGTRAGYAYDVLQRLTNLGLKNRNNAFLQSIAYTYDKAGNIKRARNTATTQNGLGGNYDYNYSYDSLYRLVSANDPKKPCKYTLNMSYLPDGRISSKYITCSSYLEGVTATATQTMTYSYSTSHSPYQVVTTSRNPSTMSPPYTTSTATYTWSANGNVTQTSDGTHSQTFLWDEENRLVRYLAPSTCGYYRYDANGERFYKCSGAYVLMAVNGRTFYTYVYTNPVLYASQYLVITPTGYTKHYYAGTERIASRIGEGRFRNMAEHCVTTAQIAAKKNSANTGLPSNYYNTNNFTYLYTLTDNTHSKAPIYWTHGDHLGSTSWVTDTAGIGVQHFRYLPFGEPLYSKKTGTFSSRYTFSGKERDAESGLNYFGARYYNSDLSIWISVDPLADKYPKLSPYTYCADNPVRLVDPEGQAVIPPFYIYSAIAIGGINALIYMYQARQSTMTISNTKQAVIHYYLGGGNKVNLDPRFSITLMNTGKFKDIHKAITSGTNFDKNGNLLTSGSFRVDMTHEKNAFFIGRTAVNYKVTTSEDKKTCTVTYTLFMKGNEPDDFSDPNFLFEQKNNDDNSRMRFNGDGMGPDLELGGKPYKFKSQYRSFTFDNPGIYE